MEYLHKHYEPVVGSGSSFRLYFLIEYQLLPMMDDVVTTGKSVIDAVNALMAEGLSPIGIISVIDREDERKIDELKNGTLKYDSIFKHSEFVDYIRTKKEQLKIKRNLLW